MQGSRDLSAAASLTEYRIDRGSLSSGTWNKYPCISITIFCSTNTAEEPIFEAENIETEIFSIGTKDIRQTTAQRILSLIREEPSISKKKIAELLGNISYGGVKYHIAKLDKSGVLERVGADFGGYWKIKTND